MKKLLEKLLSLLRVRSAVAGLEVSDQVVRLVRFDGKAWKMDAIRLEAGVMEAGVIKDRPAFVAALSALRNNVGSKDRSRRMNVSVCLSTVPMYTQVFMLPVMQGENFDKAVELNLQMASPLEAKESHSSWQIVGKDAETLRTEVLSAFVERAVVDDMIDGLFEAGFLAMAVESRALALTRVLREKGAGVDPAKPYLFVSVDNSGMDFLIIRNGFLYFEYSNSWRDLTDDKGEIATAKFEATLGASLKQVMNFYNQHWKEPLAAVILSALALEEQAEHAVAANSPLPVVRLTLVMGQPISPEWLVALGCSLRGSGLRAKTREISLLGEDSEDRFHEEQLIHFMLFWRVLVPVSMGILVLTFIVADVFLGNTKTTIEARSGLSLQGAQTAEIDALENTAQVFNQNVALVASAEAMQDPKNSVLDAVFTLAAANKISVDRFSFTAFTAPIELSGTAMVESSVVSFKEAMQADPRFTNVNLPLTAVQNQGNSTSFSMSFMFNPSAAAPSD